MSGFIRSSALAVVALGLGLLSGLAFAAEGDAQARWR